jgi:magnesium transporter
MARRAPSAVFIQKFFELDPADAAHALEGLGDEEAITIVRKVSPPVAAGAFDFLEPHFAGHILLKVEGEAARDILAHMTLARAGEVARTFPEETRENLLAQLEAGQARQIRRMITFPEDTAGRLMSPDFLAFHADLKVREAIRRLRSMSKKKVPVNYVYVTAPEGRLIGVLNMRDLLLADENAELHAVMLKEVFAVRATMDREDVARLAMQKTFQAIPVVDEKENLLGTIKLDDLVETAQEEATEDIQKMFGAGGDERVFSPLALSVRKRLPWLHVNLATAFLAAFVVSFFEDVIAKITILAVFLPVVAGQGGNAGAQSLAVVMRGLVLREVEPSRAGRVMLKEGLIGILNGVAIGIVTALVAWLWHRNPFFGLVIGLAMIINMVAACVSGAALPFLMKSLGQDPAQSSNIVLTTITDVVGFLAFLGLAMLFQDWLV